MSGAAAVLVGVALASGTMAQTTPPSPQVPAGPTLETLARDGYEIKAVQNASSRGLGFVVMMQRGAEVRTCLMQIAKSSDGRPSKQSVCF